MAIIDQRVTWRKAEERLATETDPVLRRNLELLVTHMKAEVTLDLDTLMSTVSERARYVNHTPDGPQPIEGKDAVRAFYTAFGASGAEKLQFDIDRLVVDHDGILTEGTMRMAYPGATLAARGIEVDDPEAHYLYETRMAVVWPIDEDGLFIGEDSYASYDGFRGIAERKLDESDIVLYRPEAEATPV